MDAKAPPQEALPPYAAPGGPHPGGYGYPYPYPYPYPQQQPAGVVVQQPTPTAITTPPLGRDQVTITCPHCKQPGVTATKTTPSTMAWVAGAVICLCGCGCGCCLIPCFMSDLQDVEHSCPNCKTHVGKYRR